MINKPPHGYNNLEVVILNKIFKILIYLSLIFILSGCQNKDINFKQKDIAPESLSNLNQGINDILKDIGKIEKVNIGLEVEEETASQKEDDEKKPEEDKKEESSPEESGGESGSEGDQNKENSSDSGKSENKEDKKSEDGESKEEDKKKDEIKKLWMDINKDIEKVHDDWNSYTTEGVKKGITSEKRLKFEKSLNKMTEAIEEENLINIYDFGSQSILNLKSFFDLYSDEINGEINEIKHSVYQYYIRAISGKKKEAMEVLKKREENINTIRLKLKDKEEKLKDVDKVNYSLESMEKSLEEDSKRLFSIKKDNAIKNLENLE